MKVNTKLMFLLVCVLAGTIFAVSKPHKEAKMTVKDANTTAKEAIAPAKEAAAPETKAPSVMPGPEEAAKPAGGDNDTAVTVNGIVITEAEVDAKMKPTLERVAGRIDPNMIEQYKQRIRAQVIEGMILERLLDEQIKQAGITITDSDVNDKINEITSQQGMTMDGLKAMLAMQGQNFEEFKGQVKKGLGYEKFVDKQIGEVDINDADALKSYEDNKADYNTAEQVKASHILIKVAPSATPEEKTAAKAKAESLLKEIKGGADFAALAKENSDCPSKTKGGDLGFFEKGQMVREFEDSAFAMQPGQVSDVVETQFGYHIIKVTERKEAGLTPFEKAKPEIVKMLKEMKKSQLFREFVGKLKAEATIVYPAGKEPMPMRPLGAPREVEMKPAPQ